MVPTQKYNSELLILTGPHGVGKDSVERSVRELNPQIVRTVRHITRQPSETEKNGVDYHFISVPEFQDMVANECFLEYATYPDVMSGTTYKCLEMAMAEARFATLTLNVEDAIRVRNQLDDLGIQNKIFFISPVTDDVLRSNEDEYITSLSARLVERNRPDDRIANKLAKAAIYRKIFLSNPDSFIYVYNGDSLLNEAASYVSSMLFQRP